jgi:hypothetical protein
MNTTELDETRPAHHVIDLPEPVSIPPKPAKLTVPYAVKKVVRWLFLLLLALILFSFLTSLLAC